MNLTINEIAKLAGVSKGTVSKVLNDYSGINKLTRERVLKIVRDLGYEPNSSAQALAFRKTGNIGLIIPHSPEYSLNGDYWSSLVTAITNEVIGRGYSLVLLLPQQEGNLKDLFNSIIRKRQLDGLIIGAELLEKQYLATLMYNETPFVMLGRNPEFVHYSVDIDNEDASYSMTRYMIDHGYKRVAFISGPGEYYYNASRVAGYKRAQAEAGLPYCEYRFVAYNEESAMYPVLEELFESNRPDAIFCGAGGGFMFTCLAAAQALGFTIPESGFATFDDYFYLDYVQPRITAVGQPIRQIGAEAVRIIDSLFKSNPPLEPNLVLKGTIVSRFSCGESLVRS